MTVHGVAISNYENSESRNERLKEALLFLRGYLVGRGWNLGGSHTPSIARLHDHKGALRIDCVPHADVAVGLLLAWSQVGECQVEINDELGSLRKGRAKWIARANLKAARSGATACIAFRPR